MKQPHQPRQEAIGPLRPGFVLMPPLSMLRIHRVEIRVLFYQFPDLPLRENHRVRE
jgi:hypothetical protein